MFTVYGMFNSEGVCVYVGQSRLVERRVKEHLRTPRFRACSWHKLETDIECIHDALIIENFWISVYASNRLMNRRVSATLHISNCTKEFKIQELT